LLTVTVSAEKPGVSAAPVLRAISMSRVVSVEPSGNALWRPAMEVVRKAEEVHAVVGAVHAVLGEREGGGGGLVAHKGVEGDGLSGRAISVR
jgi:hypothetical protein